MGSTVQDKTEIIKAQHKATIIGAVVNIVLSIFKIFFGIVSHSQALLIDGIHSLSDLITDALVIVTTKLANDEPDSKHPYGHQRFETLGSLAIGTFLIALAGAIIYSGFEKILSPNLQTPGWAAIVVAILSIASKEWVYHYTMAIATETKSQVLKANAWHHRTDSLSSIVVVIGLIGSYAGLNWLDPLAAIIVAVMIGKVGFDLVWGNLAELVDTAPPQDFIDNITKIIDQFPEIKGTHRLRCRKSGANILLDLHIQVEPYISVSEGHQIGDNLTHRLLTEIEEINDVTVHIDPEEDDFKNLYSNDAVLPLRSEITSILKDTWVCNEFNFGDIKRINIHYSHNKVLIELLLPKELLTSKDMFKGLEKYDWLSSIEISYYN
ncbi:MAG: cation transporter [Gammaproteobacteria bacterium]|nr:MAG: cation transporter [Gammaproteobacteria bacterium]